MAEKFVSVGSDGRQRLVEALGSSSGAADAGKIPALDAAGKLHPSMLPASVVGNDVVNIEAGELLAAGDFVSLVDIGYGLKAYKATASGASVRLAVGFVLTQTNAGAMVDVIVDSASNDKLTGLIPGHHYYLSPLVDGGVTDTVPTDPTHVVQYLGVAISSSTLRVNIDQPESVMSESAASMTAGEDITAGQFVTVGSDGLAHVASSDVQTKVAAGFAITSAASGAPIKVFLGDGANPYLSGLTAGASYYLDNAGAVTSTPDATTVGRMLQFLGVAISTTQLRCAIAQPILL